MAELRREVAQGGAGTGSIEDPSGPPLWSARVGNLEAESTAPAGSSSGGSQGGSSSSGAPSGALSGPSGEKQGVMLVAVDGRGNVAEQVGGLCSFLLDWVVLVSRRVWI